MKKHFLIFAFLLSGLQYMLAQDVLNSVSLNVCNLRLSSDAKTITYDVYLQNINKDTVVAVPGFVFRMNIPQSDIGYNAKKVVLTNSSKELGAYSETITQSGSDWTVKFLNANFIRSYETALMLSKEYPGTRIGTVNIMNEDGTAFADPISVNLLYPGSSLKSKASCTVFSPNSMTLSSNSTKALAEANFIGLGNFTLSTLDNNGFTFTPNPATKNITVNAGSKAQVLKVMDLSGKKVLSQTVSGEQSVSVSSLPAGTYILDINGTRKKLVKE